MDIKIRPQEPMVIIPIGMDCRGPLPNYRGFSWYFFYGAWSEARDYCQVCRLRRNWKQCRGWLFVKNVSFCAKHVKHPRAVALLNKCHEAEHLKDADHE